MEFYTHILGNGIRCILKRIPSPVAYSALTINAGSRDEMSSEYGIAHFTEHMLFKGTKKRKPHHINSRLEKLGGELNAFTTKEETVVHATTLVSDLPKATELISDIVFNSVFLAKQVEKEKEVVLDEINSYKDSPVDRIYDEFEDLLFSGTPLGHNILGSKRTVGKFDTGHILSFTERCYNTDQMVFSVAADISEKVFVRLAEKYLSGYGPSPRLFSREISTCTIFEKSVNRGTHQAHCILGGPAYNIYDPKRIPLSLLINILGGPAANSLLNSVLREKHGLTYSVDASFSPYTDTGIAAIYFGTDKGKTSKCLELIHNLIGQLKGRQMSGMQLAMAKKQFIGQLAVSMEAREASMLGAAKSYLVYNEVDSQASIYSKLDSITSSQIMDVANEVFSQVSVLCYNGHRN